MCKTSIASRVMHKQRQTQRIHMENIENFIFFYIEKHENIGKTTENVRKIRENPGIFGKILH